MYSKRREILTPISNSKGPEVGFNLVEMGLIYNAVCDEK